MFKKPTHFSVVSFVSCSSFSLNISHEMSIEIKEHHFHLKLARNFHILSLQ